MVQHLTFLGFPDKLLPAPGAGNGNLSLTSGNSYGLMALGAVKIPVLVVLEMFKKLQKSPVFLISFIGIPGKHPADGPDHKAIGKEQKDQRKGKASDHSGQQACDQAGCQDHHTETIRTISSAHKAADSLPKLKHQLSQPQSKTIHNINHLMFQLLNLLYCKTGRLQPHSFKINELFKILLMEKEAGLSICEILKIWYNTAVICSDYLQNRGPAGPDLMKQERSLGYES